MAERLIDRVVKSLTAPERGNKITYDTETKGFGCRVTASGSRAFVFNYRVRATGQERRFTIGAYPDWSEARARREAEDLKRRVDRGEDPMGSLHRQRGEQTVNDLCDRYIEEHLPRKRPSSQRDDKAMIAGIIKSKLGRTRTTCASAA